MAAVAIEHNEIFDLAFRFVTETSEHIFLTGNAGTGKTTFLKYLKEHCVKNLVVAAPTGVAAINAGGVTLHSLFRLPLHPFLPTHKSREDLLSKLRCNAEKRNLLCKMELLVIDEISMVRADVMDAIDCILRSVRRRHDMPFGGVQLLFIGDLYQLPPVAQQHEWSILQEYYSSPFFFDSLAIKEQMPLLIELTKIYRQKDDSFVSLLNKVRNNAMNADDFEMLNERHFPAMSSGAELGYVTLTSHNRKADEINTYELNGIIAPEKIFTAEVIGDFPENLFPADEKLKLKVGAQVMFIKNDVIYKRYFNGKIGVISSMEDDKIMVTCDDMDLEVHRESWENNRYALNKQDGKLEQENLGSFIQFPLRLAWAITIHKSQGLTFEKVRIDAAASFSSGQVYVALSRCTTLDGIKLLTAIPQKAIHSNEYVVNIQSALKPKITLAERFAGARAVFCQQMLEDLFSFEQLSAAFLDLQQSIIKHQARLDGDALSFINRVLGDFQHEKAVGMKFIGHIGSMMREQSIVEENQALQKRLSDASGHFINKLTPLFETISSLPFSTDFREAAAEVDEANNVLLAAFHQVLYFLHYSKESFSVAGFLKHKLDYAAPKFRKSIYGKNKAGALEDTTHPVLFEILKRWRNMACEDSGLPIYRIATTQTLKDLCLYLPQDKASLLHISGFGKIKVDKYGDELIDAITSYCEQHDVAPVQGELPEISKRKTAKKAAPKTDTRLLTYQLYRDGKSIDEIAGERQFTKATIEGHLSHFIKTGDLDINEVVTVQRQQAVQEVILIHGDKSLNLLAQNLPGYSYGEIRMVIANTER